MENESSRTVCDNIKSIVRKQVPEKWKDQLKDSMIKEFNDHEESPLKVPRRNGS